MRIVIADDSYLIREGTRRLLEDSGQADVLDAVGSGPDLVDAALRFRPDAVLTDIRMPPADETPGQAWVGHRTTTADGPSMEGIEAARAIKAARPEIGVVVLSQYVDETYAFELLRNGAHGVGYLLKDRIGDVDRMLHALHEVAAGGSVIDQRVVEALVARRARAENSPLASLSPRELDVLRDMAQGHGNAAIAATLRITESSVGKHVNSIFSKLGLSTETQQHRRVTAVLTFLRESGLTAG
ncbi:MAG TPA: response regulator transcription factor [Microlunatus sp.]|nr:response regulator transcription factor [Microlunatus sp.]